MSKVGIVVRTKDRPLYLERALLSIRQQTFIDWDVIVINDGGDVDEFSEVLSRVFPDATSQVKVISNVISQGRWRTANQGVSELDAEFLVIHDDDDSWEPEFLSEAVNFLEKNSELMGCVSRVRIVWELETNGSIEVVSTEIFQENLTELRLTDFLSFNRFVPIAFLYRRLAHEVFGLYREDLPVAGDWEFYMRLLAGSEIEFLGPRPLVNWHQRIHGSGSSSNSVRGESFEHQQTDLRIRDQALREFSARFGFGLPLYLDSRFNNIDVALAELRDLMFERTSFKHIFLRLRARLFRQWSLKNEK